MKEIAIDEMNFLMSRCKCVGCATSDIPQYDQYDFETLEDYREYLTTTPKCFVCEDRGYYYEEEEKLKCYCKIGWCDGITEDDIIQE